MPALRTKTHTTWPQRPGRGFGGVRCQVNARVRAILDRVLAQRRSAGVAFAYMAALSPGTRANC
jgi:hypothetical protein